MGDAQRWQVVGAADNRQDTRQSSGQGAVCDLPLRILVQLPRSASFVLDSLL